MVQCPECGHDMRVITETHRLFFIDKPARDVILRRYLECTECGYIDIPRAMTESVAAIVGNIRMVNESEELTREERRKKIDNLLNILLGYLKKNGII